VGGLRTLIGYTGWSDRQVVKVVVGGLRTLIGYTAGEVVLAPGDHVLELECAGKGERSSAHFLAVDGFMLAPVE